MCAFELTYKVYGKSAILIEWPAEISKKIRNDVVSFKNKIIQNNTKDIVDIIKTYNSITVVYHGAINIIYDDILELKSLYKQEVSQKSVKNYRWEVPVCYDKEFGIDFDGLQSQTKLSDHEIIELHISSIYTVYFIGFLPGFLYLGGLDEKLHIPRKANPRLRVPKGAVAIGGAQTGIYPDVSAGGWHIIGNSPVSFFNSKLENPCFAQSGDEIVFKSIGLERYYDIVSKVENGTYQLKKSDV